MPTWSNRLPPEGKHQGFDLRRTPISGAIQAIITSDDMIVCDTHFWHGRTTPCERIVNDEGRTLDDSPCPACQEKQAWRTHAYVSCFDARKHEHFIYECTANAAKAFAEHREAAGTLRGCVFHASRPKQTPNGKVVIQTNVVDPKKQTIPQAPDLIRALCVIWRIPMTGLSHQLSHDPDILTANGYAADVQTLRTKRKSFDEMRNQTDNAAEPSRIDDIIKSNDHAKRRQPA